MTESGWVIEHAGSEVSAPLYLSAQTGGLCWRREHQEALRFARHEDAARFAAAYFGSHDHRICEHEWG